MIADIRQDSVAEETTGDRLLMATGCKPNFGDLVLEIDGIKFSNKEIQVNDHCRTKKRDIYATGDVAGCYQFAQMSDHMAEVAPTNALLMFEALQHLVEVNTVVHFSMLQEYRSILFFSYL